jgi:hypothetical protein
MGSRVAGTRPYRSTHLFVAVSVMGIRKVRVLVLQKLVIVNVRMGLIALPLRVVGVAMMVVMHVAVLMPQG